MLDTPQIYDLSVPGYDRAHERWLRYAGGEAQCAFEGAITALLRPDMSVLDAACGTGSVARRLMATMENNLNLTLLDAAPNMLEQCGDIVATRKLGRLEKLPFKDNQFDLATCAWGLETLREPMLGIVELTRVTCVGGSIGLVFCANRPCQSMLGYGLSAGIIATGKGRFLDLSSVCKMILSLGVTDIRILHSHGPAAALIFRAPNSTDPVS